MKITPHTLALLTLVCLASACGKDKSTPKADISGEVQVLNEFGQPVADRSGISVMASTNSTQTSSAGHYDLKTASGKQTITFEKPYLGTYKLVDQPFSGTVAQPLVTLGTQPTGGVLSIVLQTGGNAVYIQGLMSEATPQGRPARKHRLFFNSGPVSPQEYTLTISGETNVGDDQFFDEVTFAQLQAAGLSPGQSIFVRAYGDNVFADLYTDPTTQRKVYPALSRYGSNTAMFTY